MAILFDIFLRYQASQVDLAVFECLSKAPASNTPHALRWYNHIKSFNADAKKKLPGQKKLPSSFGATAPAAAKPADDDDVDLFASDEEEVLPTNIFLNY